GPDIVLVVEVAKLELPVRDAIVRLEILAPDGPAAARHPGPALGVDRVEQRAAPTPDADRAAEKTQPRLIEVVVRHPDVVPLVQVLRRLLEIEATALRQTGAALQFPQASREHDAGNAGADDADVVLGNRRVV